MGTNLADIARVLAGALLAIGCGPSTTPTSGSGSGTSTSTSATLPDSGSEVGGPVECSQGRTIEGDVSVTADDISDFDDVRAITGELRIGDTSFVELQGFGCLESVGSLVITHNDSLVRMDGALQALRHTERMFVSSNPLLETLTLDRLDRIEDRAGINNNDTLTDLELGRLEFVGESFSIGSNPSLRSLAGLSSLREVDSSLSISRCHALTDLDGLGSLTTADGLRISENDGLTSLAGISVTSLGRWGLTVEINSALTSLAGLASLTAIAGPVDIAYNDSLQSLDLGGLTTVRGGEFAANGAYLSIRHNPVLTSLAGLEQLTEVSSMLHVCDNATLVDLAAVEQVEQVGQFVVIYNDALDDAAVMAHPLAASSILPAKIDANGDIEPLWWDKPQCPWPDDGVCDGSIAFNGDVGFSCEEQDCCEPGGPTRLCVDETDSEDDCPAGGGPGG